MSKFPQFYPTVRLAVCCLMLAIGLRTWLMMGLIEPVSVSGSSMVPKLRGVSATAYCPDCGHQIRVGAEFAAVTANVRCPQCDHPDVSLAESRLQRSDRLWVDRTSFLRSEPRRWDVVVARDPSDASQLCVKRIVGLPGELVSLRDGNVLIDNEVAPKLRHVQRALRQRVHTEQQRSQRWLPDDDQRWLLKDNVWTHAAPLAESVSWIQYQHPRDQPVTDDVTYNAGLTRKLNLVNEFFLSTEIHVRGRGAFSIGLDDGSATVEITIEHPGGGLSLLESGRRGPTYELSPISRQRLTSDRVQLELSNFDYELLLMIDGRVELRRPWPRLRAEGSDRPFSIGARGLSVQLGELTVYRDIYHSSHAAGTAAPRATRWQLGQGEYFLLGDNSPVSIDSRLWGPVSARLLLGKPLFSGR